MLIRRPKRFRDLAAELDRIAGGPARLRTAALHPIATPPALLLALADAIDRARLGFDANEAADYPHRFPGGPESLAAFDAAADDARRQAQAANRPAPQQAELFPEGRA